MKVNQPVLLHTRNHPVTCYEATPKQRCKYHRDFAQMEDLWKEKKKNPFLAKCINKSIYTTHKTTPFIDLFEMKENWNSGVRWGCPWLCSTGLVCTTCTHLGKQSKTQPGSLLQLLQVIAIPLPPGRVHWQISPINYCSVLPGSDITSRKALHIQIQRLPRCSRDLNIII